MKGATGLDCPACQEFYAGLAVSEGGEIAVEESVLETEPFTLFAEGKLREREREMRFMTGDICGSGFQKRPGYNMCALHCNPVPLEALVEYFKELPEEHKTALLTLREEDFAAELDAHLKYQLKICRDCRFNVMRTYRDLKQPPKGSQATEQPSLELCPHFNLKVAERLVTVNGEGITEFLNRAEDVEGCKALNTEDLFEGDQVRHAETPELAREALIDSAVLIYKSQIEVAFREQTAGHNALLLFVGLALQLMEEQLCNAYKEREAKEAEAELLDLVAKEKERSQVGSKKKKGKKGAKALDKEEAENEAGKQLPPGESRCRTCAALQQACRCGSARGPSGPSFRGSGGPVSPLQQRLPGTSPLQVPGASPGPLRQPEPEAGRWEVHQPKRRGSSQAVRRGAGIAGSLGGSSSGSTTPERRRVSLEGSSCPRPRSPFAKRAGGPPQDTAKTFAIRQSSIPLHAYSCTGAVMQQPPPPPPPREPRAGRIPAEPSPKTAWGFSQSGSASVLDCHKQPAQEWTPWHGPSPSLGAKAGSAAAPQAAKPESIPVPVRSKAHPAAMTGLLACDTFSLFHFSPVPGAAGKLQQSQAKEREDSSYQLFGSSQYPLAPLGTVVTL